MAISATIGDVLLPFCVMNASGTSSTTAAELVALAGSKAGAVVFRSTTVHPFLHPEFRSLHNPGYDRYLPLLTELKAFGKPLVGSIAGASTDEYVTLARAFGEAGADLIEVNLADPYVAATLAPWEHLGELVKLLTTARAAAGRPLMLKCPRRIPLPLGELRQVLRDGGVDAVVLANTFEVMEKFFLEGTGSVPAVVAMGGVKSGYDLASALRKGATAVQLSSDLALEGPLLFERLAREYAVLERGRHGVR
jgi:dihydroorotate dehydrogenase (fumarate)